MLETKYWAQDEILIVDDDELQRELMKNSLEDLGLEIHEAVNGAEALEIFIAQSPMLVVMDINMPVMDGYTACREMKRISGDAGAAIILVTGMDDLASVQQAFDVGAIEFITKPLDWRMLLMRVKYIMRIQQTYLGVQKNMESLAWAQRAAAVGSWDLDPQLESVCFSDELLRILGLKSDTNCYSFDVIGKAVHKMDQGKLFKAYFQLLNDNVPLDMDIHLNLGDDSLLIVHITGEQTLCGKGRRLGISGTVQDITERKLAEERIREAAAMKDQFLANMSHELRTPINGVMGMADLLDKTVLDEEQAMWVSYIGESAQHLLSVLNDVLDFSAIGSGSVSIEPAAFNLRHTIESSGKLVETMALNKELNLSVAVESDLPEMLVGDVGRIRQILLNLMGNAIKFTEQGWININISQVKNDAQSCHVKFSVKDSGIGIPLDKQTMVFEKFSQVDGSLTRKFGGTGLGLAISKDLVEIMGGEVGLQSQEGEGTEIWFVLPLEHHKEIAEDLPRNLPDAIPFASSLVRARILLVEDNPINQLFTKKSLEKLGFLVDVANNGEEALSLVQQASYGVVLMDCQMPVMDGYEATHRIRRLGQKYEELPIIALTAHALAGDRNKCLEAGMDDYMTKPFVGAGLIQFIQKWLKLDETIGV